MAEPRVYVRLIVSGEDLNLSEHHSSEPMCDFRIIIESRRGTIDGQNGIDVENTSPQTSSQFSIPVRAFDSTIDLFAGLNFQLAPLGLEFYAADILTFAFEFGMRSTFTRGFSICAVFSMVTSSADEFGGSVGASSVDEIGVLAGDSGQRGASELAIARLEKEMVHDGVDDVCAICLDGFTAARAAARLPCSHLFDYNCVVRWLQRNNSCPTCRYPIDE